MTSTLRWKGGGGEGGEGKNDMLLDVGRWVVSKCSGPSIFIFFIEINWICALSRHNANNISVTRNLPFALTSDSEAIL